MKNCDMLEQFYELYQKGQRFIVFDVETVGHSPNIIVEIGAIEAGLNFGTEYRTFQKILQYCPSSWESYQRELAIHKIPTQEIENGEDRASVLKEFCIFIQDSVLISHTNFDIHSMKQNLALFPEFAEILTWPIWSNALDSCKLSKYVYPDLDSYSLSYLAEYFQVQNPQAHRALADAYTTKRILAKLLQQYCNIKSVTITSNVKI